MIHRLGKDADTDRVGIKLSKKLNRPRRTERMKGRSWSSIERGMKQAGLL